MCWQNLLDGPELIRIKIRHNILFDLKGALHIRYK